jgi:hypothetical protein
VPLAEKDAKLAAAERAKQARAYADRAIELLGEAIAKGFENAALMQKDTDLASLRSRPDFQQLVQELEAKTKSQSK